MNCEVDMTKSNKCEVKLTKDKYGRVVGSEVKYKTGGGGHMTISMGWQVKEGCHGAYCQNEDYLVTMNASIRKFIFSRKFLLPSIEVGHDEWRPGGGGGSTGAQNFEEAMKNETLFNGILDDSPIKPFFERARKDTVSAINDDKRERENNKILEAKKRNEILEKWLR